MRNTGSLLMLRFRRAMLKTHSFKGRRRFEHYNKLLTMWWAHEHLWKCTPTDQQFGDPNDKYAGGTCT